MTPRVHLYVDNSNIFISAKAVADRREGRFARDAVRLQFEHLFQLAHAGRPIAKACVIGSIPPEQRMIWDRLEATTGVKPELYERGGLSNSEQGLDQCLQVHMLRAVSDNADPQIAVLMTGDGAGYEDGVGFHADMARMHAAGWGIEVLSWELSCRRALKEWAVRNGCFIPLDDYYPAITFLEGGIRQSIPLNLTHRPRASTRPGPAQLAEVRARHESAREIAELQRELQQLKERTATKDLKRERFLRKQARRQQRNK